jgi:NAD(P)H-nitrite reductase large subunit
MAQKHAWTRVEQIQASTRAGTGCGSCVPYLHQVLSTGHTSFAVACNGQIPCPAPADPWD